jgi:putative DNA primase/helicase
VSETVGLPVRCGWIATGNNLLLSDEMTRRTVRVHLDSGEEFPETRNGVRHPTRTCSDGSATAAAS